MKEFDVIDKIGKKMPYKAPSEEFFNNFKQEMMDRVAESKPQAQLPQWSLKRLFVPVFTAAAALLVGVFMFDGAEYLSSSQDLNYLVSDNIDASIDSYFDNLSDEDLAYLLDNTSSQDDFYATLPINE